MAAILLRNGVPNRTIQVFGLEYCCELKKTGLSNNDLGPTLKKYVIGLSIPIRKKDGFEKSFFFLGGSNACVQESYQREDGGQNGQLGDGD